MITNRRILVQSRVMERMFEELDYQPTSMGELVLRRRRSLARPGTVVYEVTLDGAFLMSSLVHSSEAALADIPLRTFQHADLDVLVAGLGLGHTAAAALAFPNVRRVDVIEYLAPVIDWHQQQLVPASATLTEDPRCNLVEADFFALVDGSNDRLTRPYDAILVDIDHAPQAVLASPHAWFYTEAGLRALREHLKAGGVFGLWSAEKPDDVFVRAAQNTFTSVAMHPVSFTNPSFHGEEENWIVVAENH